MFYRNKSDRCKRQNELNPKRIENPLEKIVFQTFKPKKTGSFFLNLKKNAEICISDHSRLPQLKERQKNSEVRSF